MIESRFESNQFISVYFFESQMKTGSGCFIGACICIIEKKNEIKSKGKRLR